MAILRPLPRSITRPLSLLVLVAWVVAMAAVINRSYLQASSANLATDLARYGSTAVWRGVYYRGEKIGFTVSQTVRTDDGFELQEDGRLQMLLLGQDTAATIRTTARVTREFVLQSFDFSLDPGTGPTEVRGEVTPNAGGQGPFRLALSITSSGATRTETRELKDPPVIPLNLGRMLAGQRLATGSQHAWMVLDPATLQSGPVTLRVRERGVVRADDTNVPAFRVEMDFQGLHTTAWVTDTGDVVREESALGLITVRESAERARGLAVPGRMRADLLRASAVVPVMSRRIDEGRDVRRLVVRLDGVPLDVEQMNGVGQKVDGTVVELTAARSLTPGAPDPDAGRFLAPEALIESDAPEIKAEVEIALRQVGAPPGAAPQTDRERAERLTRYVNALLDKKPTVSLPSARDVLRTKVGDCNEHTALYVAMARAAGIPSRIAVGLVYMHGAFYYHAWPEVYIRERDGRALWLPVDPTLNQFPADATHLRLARGGLEKQAAILPMIGRLKMTVLDVELAPDATRILVGRSLDPQPASLAELPLHVPRQTATGCECGGNK